MGHLQIQESLSGTQIRFPMNGQPPGARGGQLYQIAVWVCALMPWSINHFGHTPVMLTLLGVSLAVMLGVSWQSRRMSLQLTQNTLQINAPWQKRAVPLEEIDALEMHKDDNTAQHYITLTTGQDTLIVSPLLSKSVANTLLTRLLCARRAPTGIDSAAARPPQALQELLGQATSSASR